MSNDSPHVVTGAAQRFTETAAGYAATMAPSLAPVAERVVRSARLGPGERVLDLGTGTGTAAALARGEGRRVTGIDAAAGMLAIARAQVRDVEVLAMDFSALSFDDGAFDVLLAVHALLFANDQGATLAEWLRVVRPGGRLSLSVPGPMEVTPAEFYRSVYRRHGIEPRARYPTLDALTELVRATGWSEVAGEADPTAAIVLGDEEAFRTWREIGFRNPATERFTPEQHRALTEAMLATTPRDADGAFRIPFGALYVTARRTVA